MLWKSSQPTLLRTREHILLAMQAPWPCSFSTLVLVSADNTWANGQGYVPTKLYLLTLKFEFHIIFCLPWFMILLTSPIIYKDKNHFSSWVIQKWVAKLVLWAVVCRSLLQLQQDRGASHETTWEVKLQIDSNRIQGFNFIEFKNKYFVSIFFSLLHFKNSKNLTRASLL